jgi:exosortase/archaeosortase family protein
VWKRNDGKTLRLRLPEATPGAAELAPAVLLTVLYAGLYRFLPQLVCCGLAATALACSLSVCLLGRKFHAGLWSLLLLSLPLMDSLDFYAGFPLRVAVAHMSAAMLSPAGIAVEASGTALDWSGLLISVDAPCSGLRMLWAGALVTACVACYRGFGFRQMVRAGLWAFVIIVAGNVLRTTCLFVAESSVVPAPPWFHTSAGLIVFAVTVAALLFLALRLPVQPDPVPSSGGAAGIARVPAILMLFAAVAAAAAPLLATTTDASHEGFPGWPETFEGRRLEALPLSEQEAGFERAFPGRIGRFTDGNRTIVLRWVNRPSRLVHPADVCFRALGFSVQPAPLVSGCDGRLWSAFVARRGADSLRVRAQFRDSEGMTWPDVSSWFWASALGRSAGPWWAVTVAEHVPAVAQKTTQGVLP